MDIISKALADVHFSIPREVLNLGFNDNPIHSALGIDEIILSRVVRPRVLVDCDIVGGMEIIVDVDRCAVYDYSDQYMAELIIDVPKSITGGKSIISPLGLFVGIGRGVMGSQQGGNMSDLLAMQMNAASPPASIATARLELVGENKVLVTEPTMTFVGGSLKCVVGNNPNLSNINARSSIAFSKLVILCVKAYIYNHLVVSLAKGYIYNGHELGIVNDIVDSYEPSLEEYGEYLRTTWTQVAFHSDRTRLANAISTMF